MAKSHTHGHTIHLEKLSDIPDYVIDNIEPGTTLWNAFDIEGWVGYFIIWNGKEAKNTYHNHVVTDRDEETAVKGVVYKLFPESTIVTDPKEIEKYKKDLQKSDGA